MVSEAALQLMQLVHQTLRVSFLFMSTFLFLSAITKHMHPRINTDGVRYVMQSCTELITL